MSAPRLSAIVLTLNEEANLRKLLPRLTFADEILVVDGGSVDATVDTARELGVVVVSRRFDDFAAQRNAAMQAACGDWILYVDADERPSRLLPDEIRRRIAIEGHCGYRVPIRSTIFGRQFRFSGTQNDEPLRLVARSAGTWAGAVHEQFSPRGSVGKLEAHLEHHTLPSVPAFLGKMQRYTSLAAEARVAEGRRPRTADQWLHPVLEFYRRLIWKHGWLDGPEGWAFCGLSALSEWLLASKHRRLWHTRYAATSLRRSSAVRRSWALLEGANP